jgi:hypothetical protein
MLLLPHPTCSSDLSLADFFLFPKMKMQLKVRHFYTIAKIQHESQKVMASLTQQWQECCDQCIAVQGDYFEDVQT